MKKFTILFSAFLLCLSMLSYGQWTYTNLSEAKAYMGATVLGSKAYLAGGYNNSTMLSTVEIYDFATGEWDITNNLSVARELPFAVACGSKVIFAGGANFSTGAVFSTVDIFDTVTQEWTVEQLSVPRLQAAVVSHGNKVLFAGGANLQQSVVYDIVDIYDIETGEWSTATLSEPRVVWWATVSDLAIFAGGYNLQTSSKRVDIYNFTTDTWSIDSLSAPRAFVGMTTIGSKVMIAGGMTSGNNPSDIVDIYDASAGTWETANISVPLAFSDNQNAVAMGGKVYFVGGGKINLNGAYWTAAYNVIDIYDPVSNTWSVDYLADSFVHRAVVSVGDQFLVAGGITMNNVYKSDVEIYSCSCLPEGITFTTQEEIDNFQTNYPGCTEIEGNVTINGDDITNLNGLESLTSIGGSLQIGDDINACNPSLANLTGINNLSSIGGYLEIAANIGLTSLTGLESLISIGEGLIIWGNNALTSLTGLESLTSIGGGLSIGAYIGNPVLTSLSGLESLISIGGHLVILGNSALTSLSGLENLTSIGGDLWIYGNDALTSLAGVDNLTSIGGSLYIGESWNGGNPSLANLTGINNLTSIGGNLSIYENNALTSLAGLENLSTIGGYLEIYYNETLTSLAGLENIQSNSIDSLVIINNVVLSECDVQSICDYLASPNATIEIHDNAPGCNSPEEVEEHCLTIIEDIDTGDGIEIIPNPSKDKITISSSAITGITQLSIFNVNGELVIEGQLTDNETQIDIIALPRGVYFVRLQNKTMVEEGKMVKE